MAVSFLNKEVSELCLGKPALRSSVTTLATVKDALTALKRSGEIHVSVWSCGPNHSAAAALSEENYNHECACIGKICMADVICFLCKKENLADPFKAFEAPVLDLLPKVSGIVKHLEPNSSLLEAMDCILEGTQNLVIPIEDYSSPKSRRKFLYQPSLIMRNSLHNGREYCWLTREDVVRFLLNSVGVFSPLPAFTIESLNIIDHNVMTVHYHDPASLALASISRSIIEQTCVAVVDDDNRLIGDISPFTLACCDETVAAAVMTLSAGDLMAYIDYGGPPEDLVQLVKMRLEEKDLGKMLQLLEDLSLSSMSSSSSSSCSSDDESVSSRHNSGSGRYSSGRRSEAIMCYPWSSLVAVMIQALAHRVSYIWVVQEDQTLSGIVTFEGILKIFRSIAGKQHKPEKGKHTQAITNIETLAAKLMQTSTV